jgi:hypothetical protein
MKKVFLVYHTDIWQSWGSHRVVGIGSTLNKAVALAKKDKDAVADVESQDGHIVIYEFEVNKIESEKQVFSTDKDDDRLRITKKERE